MGDSPSDDYWTQWDLERNIRMDLSNHHRSVDSHTHLATSWSQGATNNHSGGGKGSWKPYKYYSHKQGRYIHQNQGERRGGDYYQNRYYPEDRRKSKSLAENEVRSVSTKHGKQKEEDDFNLRSERHTGKSPHFSRKHSKYLNNESPSAQTYQKEDTKHSANYEDKRHSTSSRKSVLSWRRIDNEAKNDALEVKASKVNTTISNNNQLKSTEKSKNNNNHSKGKKHTSTNNDAQETNQQNDIPLYDLTIERIGSPSSSTNSLLKESNQSGKKLEKQTPIVITNQVGHEVTIIKSDNQTESTCVSNIHKNSAVKHSQESSKQPNITQKELTLEKRDRKSSSNKRSLQESNDFTEQNNIPEPNDPSTPSSKNPPSKKSKHKNPNYDLALKSKDQTPSLKKSKTGYGDKAIKTLFKHETPSTSTSNNITHPNGIKLEGNIEIPSTSHVEDSCNVNLKVQDQTLSTNMNNILKQCKISKVKAEISSSTQVDNSCKGVDLTIQDHTLSTSTNNAHQSSCTNTSSLTSCEENDGNIDESTATVDFPEFNDMMEGGESERHLEAVRALLVCFKCKQWLIPEQVCICMCNLVCQDCALDMPQCAECETTFDFNMRLTFLYHRISSVISHPCPHKDCEETVQPQDQHEANCSFRPFECRICEMRIPSTTAWLHFELIHPNRIPLQKGMNKNVLATQFWDNTDTEKMIYCFINEQFIEIRLSKMDEIQSIAEFIITQDNADDNAYVTVKFTFKKDDWDCTRKNCRKQKKDLSTSLIEVPLGIAKDWLNGQCTLDISVVVRNKRKCYIPYKQKKCNESNKRKWNKSSNVKAKKAKVSVVDINE